MMMREPFRTGGAEADPPLLRTIRAALVWIAAFSFSVGIFFTLTKLLRGLPPTSPTAIGRVTVDGVSKSKDYLTALLFLLVTPTATVYLAATGRRLLESMWRVVPAGAAGSSARQTSTVLFTIPFFLSPALYLTTRKEGWALLLPLIVSQFASRAYLLAQRKSWFSTFWRPDLYPFHGLMVCEALSWIIFRYLVTGVRIAHIPTLFLESIFVAFFLAVFHAAGIVIARMASFILGRPVTEMLRAFAIGASPLLVLPFLGLALISERTIAWAVLPAAILGIVTCLLRPPSIRPRTVWRAVAYVLAPALIFTVSYASTADLSQWIDLFHRGESLGPASDYLKGKVPYRDVFVLHGMLDDGLLDAWLMEIFGRDLRVAILRVVILGCFAMPALWLLGVAMFESILLALLVTSIGFVNFVENQRTLFEIVSVALIVYGMKRGRMKPIVASGIVAGVALFFSFEIGIYSVASGVVAFTALALLKTRVAAAMSIPPGVALVRFLAGVAAGMSPFLIYLAARGALGDAFSVSFFEIPRMIDAVWSLPFPDLTRVFRQDLSLRSLSEFILSDRFRFVLNPLILAITGTYLLGRIVTRSADRNDQILLVVFVFAVLSQRSALGRADFAHQYFSAFLTGPVMVGAAVVAFQRGQITHKHAPVSTAIGWLSVVVLAPFLAVIFWIPDLLNGRLDALTRYRPRVSGIGFADPAGEVLKGRIEAVSQAVGSLVPPQGTLFDFSNQPAFYFFADRMNPTRFYQIPILSPIRYQREAISALERRKPAVVLRISPEGYDRFDDISNELRAPAVAAYIDDHYRYHSTVRGVEIWTRRAREGLFIMQRYLSRIVIPSPQRAATAGRRRIFFPAVGNVLGIGGSHWRSDLIAYNPSGQALPLSIRYSSSKGTLDRAAMIPPRKQIVIRDIAMNLFALPESRGFLRIEHRSDVHPAIRVRTYDSSRPASSTSQAALTAGDAAHHFGPNELAFVGLSATEGERINIGVVNIADMPARIRFYATTAEGEIVGVPVETSVGEASSYLLPDANRQLGIPIDERVIVRVRVLQGSVIGFASVIEGLTGDQEFLPAVVTNAP